MGSSRRAFACVLAVVGVIFAGVLASCEEPASHVAVRATLKLPLPVNTVVHGEFVTRRLTVPRGYGSAGRPFYLESRTRAGVPEPLVLLLHGLYQTPAEVEQATGAAAYSEEQHFTLVYPVGEHRAWDAGYCCRRDSANDLGYL